MKTILDINNKPIHRFVYGLINSNMYIIIGNSSAIMIDSIISKDADDLLKKHNIKNLWILLTHEHYDHIQGINYYRQHFNCCVIANNNAIVNIKNPKKNLAAYIDSIAVLKDMPSNWRVIYQIPEDYSSYGDIGFEQSLNFYWDDIIFTMTHTPGHSQGSSCISAQDHFYFTGDSLINEHDTILRLPGSNRNDYYTFTKPFLDNIPPNAYILPGHGIEFMMSDHNKL